MGPGRGRGTVARGQVGAAGVDDATSHQEGQAGRTGVEPRALGRGPRGVVAGHEAARRWSLSVGAASSQALTSHSEVSSRTVATDLCALICALTFTVMSLHFLFTPPSGDDDRRDPGSQRLCLLLSGWWPWWSWANRRGPAAAPRPWCWPERPAAWTCSSCGGSGRCRGPTSSSGCGCFCRKLFRGLRGGDPPMCSCGPCGWNTRPVQNPADEGAAPVRPANKAWCFGAPRSAQDGLTSVLCAETISACAESSLELADALPDFTRPPRTCVSERRWRTERWTRDLSQSGAASAVCHRCQGGHCSAWRTVGAP